MLCAGNTVVESWTAGAHLQETLRPDVHDTQRTNPTPLWMPLQRSRLEAQQPQSAEDALPARAVRPAPVGTHRGQHSPVSSQGREQRLNRLVPQGRVQGGKEIGHVPWHHSLGTWSGPGLLYKASPGVLVSKVDAQSPHFLLSDAACESHLGEGRQTIRQVTQRMS